MHRLHPEKLITVIASDVLESRLVKAAVSCGATGYTALRARGAGTSGEQSGTLDIDTNIVFQVVAPVPKVSCILDALEALRRKGHHLVVVVADVHVMWPENFE